MKYLALFPNWIPLLAAFHTGKEVGQFLEKVFAYMQTGNVPDGLSEMGAVAFAVMRPFIDSTRERYNRKSQQMRINGRKGGLAKSLNNRLRAEAEYAESISNFA